MFDQKKLAELRDAQEKWEETTLQQTLARTPERQEKFITTSSEEVERLYTPLELASIFGQMCEKNHYRLGAAARAETMVVSAVARLATEAQPIAACVEATL